MQSIKLFLSTLVFVLLLDVVWLLFLGKNLYLNELGELLRKFEAVNWYAVAGVYILLVLGILLFVLPKANGDYLSTVFWGAFFGLIIYGIYNLTNYSVFVNWPLKITLIDSLWGIFLCVLASLFANLMQNTLR
jgi:uncharacterized membrane protein